MITWVFRSADPIQGMPSFPSFDGVGHAYGGSGGSGTADDGPRARERVAVGRRVGGLHPDGGSLIYSARHDIERIPVSGGTPETLARLSLPQGASATTRFDLDGTGRHLLYTHDWRLHHVDLRDASTRSVPIETGDLPPGGDTPEAVW